MLQRFKYRQKYISARMKCSILIGTRLHKSTWHYSDTCNLYLDHVFTMITSRQRHIVHVYTRRENALQSLRVCAFGIIELIFIFRRRLVRGAFVSLPEETQSYATCTWILTKENASSRLPFFSSLQLSTQRHFRASPLSVNEKEISLALARNERTFCFIKN